MSFGIDRKKELQMILQNNSCGGAYSMKDVRDDGEELFGLATDNFVVVDAVNGDGDIGTRVDCDDVEGGDTSEDGEEGDAVEIGSGVDDDVLEEKNDVGRNDDRTDDDGDDDVEGGDGDEIEGGAFRWAGYGRGGSWKWVGSGVVAGE